MAAEYELRPCRYCGDSTSEVSQLCAGICQEEYFGETRAEHEEEEPEEIESEEL